MGMIKLRDSKFEVAKYDGSTNCLLREKQIKGVFHTTRLGKLLKSKPNNMDQDK